mmetsp:Transcript_72413/g.143578  ORF Transcript_72413/g.143578 Transcript_72413/m.143578 type:complete len:104 (+) Transcript_72413:1139-1450(+)
MRRSNTWLLGHLLRKLKFRALSLKLAQLQECPPPLQQNSLRTQSAENALCHAHHHASPPKQQSKIFDGDNKADKCSSWPATRPWLGLFGLGSVCRSRQVSCNG